MEHDEETAAAGVLLVTEACPRCFPIWTIYYNSDISERIMNVRLTIHRDPLEKSIASGAARAKGRHQLLACIYDSGPPVQTGTTERGEMPRVWNFDPVAFRPMTSRRHRASPHLIRVVFSYLACIAPAFAGRLQRYGESAASARRRFRVSAARGLECRPLARQLGAGYVIAIPSANCRGRAA